MFIKKLLLYFFCALPVCFCAYVRPLEHIIADIDTLDHKPVMSTPETVMFAKTLCTRPLKRVIEFGTGGSTLVAALCNVDELYSVDSSEEWLDKLGESQVWATSRTSWYRFWADIGPLREFGHPVAEKHRGFDAYSKLYEILPALPADVVLVDGRFRVACALRALRFMEANSLLVVHDYDREYYFAIEEMFDKLQHIDTIATFKRKKKINLTRWRELVEYYKEKPE